jgi:hypothetical protein
MSTATPMSTKVSDITGNGTTEQKEACLQAMSLYNSLDGIFAHSVGVRIRIVDVSIEPFGNFERAKVACETTVEHGRRCVAHLSG